LLAQQLTDTLIIIAQCPRHRRVMSKVVAGAGSCTGSGPRVSAGLPRSSRVRRALRRCRPIILLLSRDFNLGVSMRYSAPKTAARYNPARSRQGPAEVTRTFQQILSV